MFLFAADSLTISFMKQHMDLVFGFPSIVRWSWQTAKEMFEKEGVATDWYNILISIIAAVAAVAAASAGAAVAAADVLLLLLLLLLLMYCFCCCCCC